MTDFHYTPSQGTITAVAPRRQWHDPATLSSHLAVSTWTGEEITFLTRRAAEFFLAVTAAPFERKDRHHT